MKTEAELKRVVGSQEPAGLAKIIERIQEICGNCHPLTPMACVTRCEIWKLKNQLRKLNEKMQNPRFMTDLLNTLKNRRRLKLLNILSKGRHSITTLQQKMKKLGYYHSQGTIADEYLSSLIEVGLAEENHNKYKTTLFGRKLNELIQDFDAIEAFLPPHSKCYEEKTINALFKDSKTYKELEFLIPTESLSRVLKRLQAANLITKDNENNYIFYFKTKRNPQEETLSPTEKRVYNNLPEEGITSAKLATKTRISLRRTYKYLRKLKGKKLAFKRKRPKTYTLTIKGAQIAKLLQKIHKLILEFSQSAVDITKQPSKVIQQAPVPDIPKKIEKPLQIPVST